MKEIKATITRRNIQATIRGAIIKGEQGEQGLQGEVDYNLVNAEIQRLVDDFISQIDLEALRGKDGLDGQNGLDGLNGIDGKDAELDYNFVKEELQRLFQEYKPTILQSNKLLKRNAQFNQYNLDKEFVSKEIKRIFNSWKKDLGNLKGEKGDKGEKGERGAYGPQGPAGQGIIGGGVTGQVLTKKSDTSYDLEWKTPTGGGGGGSVAWGGITGTLSNQTDLQTALDGKVNDTGDTMTGDLKILSNASGGENTFDSTNRIILNSYQRAEDTTNLGEVARIYSDHPRSKQMLAWYKRYNAANITFTDAGDVWNATQHFLEVSDRVVLATTGTLPTGYSVGTTDDEGNTTGQVYYVVAVTSTTFQLSTTKGGSVQVGTGTGTGVHSFKIVPQLKAWIGWHYLPNDIPDPVHDHISIETNDADGLIRTRFEVTADNATTAQVNTTNANFTVIQGIMGVTGADGQSKQIVIYRAGTFRDKTARWSISGNATLESGSNAGSDFQISRFNDAGSFIDSPFFINRATGNVGIGTLTPTGGKLHTQVSTDITGQMIRNTAGGGNNAPLLSLETQTTGSRVIQAGLQSDTTKRLSIETSGRIEWGAGGSTARDTNLYRSAADTLNTDDNFIAGGTITGAGLTVDSADNTLVVDAVNNMVGIGTATPAQALDVVGQVASSSFFRTNSGLTNNSSGNNATIRPQTTGTLIDRNVADGNPVLRVQNINAGSTGDVLRLQDSSTNNLVVVDVSGQMTMNGRSSSRTLNIVPQVNQSASNVTGGALRVDNTNSNGLGTLIYTNGGAGQTGRLLDINVANSAYDRAGVHMDYAGTANAFEISNTGTGTSNIALNVVSTNSGDSAVGIAGSESSRGTVKIVHNKPTGSDAGSSALSLRANGSGTAAHAIFFDAEQTGGTTGDLMLMRQNGVNTWRIDKDGILQVGTIPTARVQNLSGTNTGDQNTFSTIAVAGQSNVVANNTSDTLTLVAGSNITITTNATNDEITINSTGGGGGGGFTYPQLLSAISLRI